MKDIREQFLQYISEGNSPSIAMRRINSSCEDEFGTMTVVHLLRTFNIPFDIIREIQFWNALYGSNGLSDGEVDSLLERYVIAD